MANERITADMNMRDVIITMSDGNLGAVTCMINMLQTDPSTALLDIIYFDSMEIYGSKIYMLWNDCCDRDMSRLKKTIQYLRSGVVSKEEIHENLNRVRAKPFIE